MRYNAYMHMTTAFSLSLETVNALRAEAAAIGVPYSALVELAIRFTLTKMPKESLRKWAEAHRVAKASAAAKPVRPPKGPARLAFKTMTRYGYRWISFQELTNEYGAEAAQALWVALQGLLERGQVECNPGRAPTSEDSIGPDGIIPWSEWRIIRPKPLPTR